MQSTTSRINGIDLTTLNRLVESCNSPQSAASSFKVTTRWAGGTRTQTDVRSWSLGGRELPRGFSIASDEPPELCGKSTAPNPQELLMAALNACMSVGYVAGCAIRGIELESLEIETAGDLDLRGFLGLEPDVKPGYDSLQVSVRIKGSGTPEQFREIHDTVMKTSPNYFNITRPIPVRSALRVG